MCVGGGEECVHVCVHVFVCVSVRGWVGEKVSELACVMYTRVCVCV